VSRTRACDILAEGAGSLRTGVAELPAAALTALAACLPAI
jgi:hypothetical protein